MLRGHRLITLRPPDRSVLSPRHATPLSSTGVLQDHFRLFDRGQRRSASFWCPGLITVFVGNAQETMDTVTSLSGVSISIQSERVL